MKARTVLWMSALGAAGVGCAMEEPVDTRTRAAAGPGGSWQRSMCGASGGGWVSQSLERFFSGPEVHVGDFGAIADDGIDDTDAIQAAIDAAAEAGGGVVRLAPTGIYDLSIRNGSALDGDGLARWSHALALRPGVMIDGGFGGPGATLRLMDQAGPYVAIFAGMRGDGPGDAGLEDVWIEDLIIDANSAGNPVGEDFRGNDPRDLRAAIRVATGQRVGVFRTEVQNADGGVAVELAGEVSEACVLGSRVSLASAGISTPEMAPTHPRTAIRVDASGALVHGNDLGASAKNLAGLDTAIEIRGDGVLVSENLVADHAQGVVVSSVSHGAPRSLRGQLVRDNTIAGAARGVVIDARIFAAQACETSDASDCVTASERLQLTVADNYIGIATAPWRMAGAGPLTGISLAGAGKGTQDGELLAAAGMSRLRIERNEIAFDAVGAQGCASCVAADARSAAIALDEPGAWLAELAIADNTVRRPLAAGVSVTVAEIDALLVAQNQFTDVGRAATPVGDVARTGVLLRGIVGSGEVSRNCIADSGAAASGPFAVHAVELVCRDQGQGCMHAEDNGSVVLGDHQAPGRVLEIVEQDWTVVKGDAEVCGATDPVSLDELRADIPNAYWARAD